jgi:hypothetical protein
LNSCRAVVAFGRQFIDILWQAKGFQENPAIRTAAASNPKPELKDEK